MLELFQKEGRQMHFGIVLTKLINIIDLVEIYKNKRDHATKMSQKDEIRVLFLGDSGVGKTSIIHTIVMESFPKNVERIFQTVTISPELYLLPNNTNTVLVDSDASETGPGEQ